MIDAQSALRGYSVGKPIGKGARSVIYEVTRKEDGERFAAKFVAVRTKADLAVVRHLENEYRVLRLLHQDEAAAEAIVRAIEFRRVRRLLKVEAAYLILERVEGKSLADLRDRSPRIGVYIFYQVSKALDYIHSRGYVYADLKPHNILLQEKLRVKLIDFGFASPIGSMLRGLKGTWGYLAPEQAGGRLDSSTDVFNLGAVMYWFFAGQQIPAILPSSRGQGGFIAAKRLKLTPPHHINTEIPEALSRLIVRACKGDAAKRPSMQSIVALLHDLELGYELEEKG